MFENEALDVVFRSDRLGRAVREINLVRFVAAGLPPSAVVGVEQVHRLLEGAFGGTLAGVRIRLRCGVALALIVGSLMAVWKNAQKMKISDEQMRKIQARKAEIEAEESAEDKEW